MSAKSNGKANGHAPTNGFKPGQSGNPTGRKPGTPNKTTTALKLAILGAADIIGEKRALRDAVAEHKKLLKQGVEVSLDQVLDDAPRGVVRFLIDVFEADYKVAGSLLGRVLPLVLKDETSDPLGAEVRERAERFTALMGSLIDRAEKARLQ